MSHPIELLAPARTADIGTAAIAHGADAVYIGGPSFGARSNADNSVSDIARLVAYAHRFRARIFVTFNTILRDDELEAARKLTHELYDAGVDALIIQDMGLLELDLPPIQLHASTQTDIRTPEKARFLQDVGLSQIVLARELTLEQIAAIRAATDPKRCTLEFFVHGALCVAYSGQCYISHAHTGRSANRGDCSQACRLPYQVKDSAGRILAHDKHVLSMKDNNQSANLAALIAAGVQSFKIEGRYKDLAYVKNVTGHYRRLLDELIDSSQRTGHGAEPSEHTVLSRSASGRTRLYFTPDPDQNFNREFTDYFVQGRKDDIGAFDSPKNPGQAIGWVTQVGAQHVELQLEDPETELHNGDGLCYYSLQKDLLGLPINRVEPVAGQSGRWRVEPKDPIASYKDLRKNTPINRNRDMSWVRALEKKSSERRMALSMTLCDTPTALRLQVRDEDGIEAQAEMALPTERAQNPDGLSAKIQTQLARLGETDFEVRDLSADIAVSLSKPWFIPPSQLNSLRRAAMQALQEARESAWQRLPRAAALEPPPLYPEDSLTYLANVYNHKARDFYAKHGVKVIESAYESHEATGEVSLMITKHCVRYSLSLCPKQAKGVTGVQGTVRAEPLQLLNGKEKLTLRFDCKACEMHVVGKIKPQVLRGVPEAPIQFYRQRPAAA